MEKPVRSSFQYLSISYECALAIGNSLNLPEMLHEVIHTMVHKTNAHRGIIWIKNGEQKFQPVANAGIKIEDVLAQGEIKDLRDVLNQIQKRQQFVLKYKDDKDFLQYCPVLTGKEESVLIVPVTNVAILYLVYASREIADEPLANLLSSLSKKLSVAIEACTAHENVIKEIQVREKAEKELTKKTEQLFSSEKELQGLYEDSEQARKSLLSILEDVAQKEEALKETTKLLQSIMDNATNEAIITTDQMGIILNWNEGARRLLGYESEEMVGRESIRIFHTEEYLKSGIMDVNNKRMIATGNPLTEELDYVTKDGKTIPVQEIVSPRFDEDGKFIGTVGMVRDITERKKAEEALRLGEQNFRDLVENLMDGVAIADENAYHIYVNPKFSEITGYSRDELLNMTGWDFTPPEDLPKLKQRMKDRMAGKTVQTHYDRTIVKKDGTKIPVEMSSTVTIWQGKKRPLAIIHDITERKKAEVALRIERDNLNNIFEAIKDGIYIVNQHYDIQYVNPVLTKDFGAYEGRKCYEYFHNLTEVCPWCKNPDVFAGKTVRWEWKSPHNQKTYDLIDTPLKNPDGSISKLEIFRDITERKKAEAALRENQERLGTIMSTMDIGLILHNPDRTVAWVNQWVRQMFQHGDPVGRVCYEFFEETSSPCDSCAVRDCFETGEICTVESYNQATDRWYLSTAHPMKENAKHVTQVLESVMDITERKQVEIALQESEHRLLRAQEVAHVGDWEFDVKTGVSVWSDEIYSIYGFDPADEIESETMLARMHPDDLDYVNKKFAGWVKNGEGKPFEYRIVRPDGSIRHVYSPAEVVRDSNGNVVKVYGTALDITDQKNAEESLKIYAEELARSNDELKSLDKMKNEFLSNVSHELKTPLISIKGFSEVVQNELYGPLNDQQKKAMSTVIRNSERLGRLIDSILYLTVKKAGRDTYMFVPVNMSVIIDNAIIDISPQANSKELTIEQDIAPDLLLINGDIDKLAQVLTNLIENATKFTNNGGKITVKAYNEDENVHITVSDTGIGISNKVISNLFDKFYQVDASTTRRYGGTGIGLYISKLIVEVHNGKIWAESEEEVGTTFHVVLPK